MTIDHLKQDITFDTRLRQLPLSFRSTWGLFSPKAIDEGTDLLVNHLTVAADADCLDLGCGYGPLGIVMAKLAPQGKTVLVDKDFVAVNYSNANIELNQVANATAYLSNGFSAVPADQKFDVIASNIPAKIGGELLSIFLQDAYDHLNPGGQFYIVTVSGLKDYMKRNFTEVFGNYDKLKQSKTYTAAVAIKR